MATEKSKNKNRFTIGIGGGHREYQINDVTYVVSGEFMKPTNTDQDITLADRVETILNDEFVDLKYKDEESTIRSKPVRSTAREER